MNGSTNKIYEYEITTLSPIHIGSGEEYLYGIDIIDNKIMDLNSLMKKLSNDNDKDKLDELSKNIASGNILDFYNNNKDLFKKAILGEIGIDIGNSNIKRFIKDGFGNLFLPGSSLKGSIRTAIIHFLLVNKKNEIGTQLTKLLENYLEKNKENKKPQPFKYADSGLLKSTLGKDPNHNLMRILNVTDSKPFTEHKNIYKVEVFGSKKLTTFYEMIPQNTKIYGCIKIDKFLRQHINELRMKNFPCDELLDVINKMSAKIISYHLGYASLLNKKEEYNSFFGNIFNKLKDNEAILNLGAGIGWIGMTGDLIEDNKSADIRDALDLAPNHKNFPFPKTRRLVYDHLNNKYIPPGWIKIAIAGLNKTKTVTVTPIEPKITRNGEQSQSAKDYNENKGFSLKDTLKKPLDNVRNISKDKIYEGEIINIKEYGFFIKIDNNITGLLHKSEIDENSGLLNQEPKKGQKVRVKIKEIKNDNKISFTNKGIK